MAAKLIVLVAALSACQAVPVWIGNYPHAVFRDSRSPNIAFGFGSGFSSNIGGISHSTGYGTSFQSGDAEAYGAGIASHDGRTFARGVGIAKASPAVHRPFSYHQPTHNFNNGIVRNSYGSAVSSAQNFGNFGSAVSAVHSLDGFGSAISSVQNDNLGRYQSAVSAAQNYRGLGFESAVASANSYGLGHGSAVSAVQNVGNFRSATSSAQTYNGYNNNGAAVAAAENFGNYKGSTAQTFQQRGGEIQQSGASSINAPGVQAANSHAINTGYY